jgi:hypothetical protein
MAMTTCKECRRPMASEAPTCPHCGVASPGEGGVERDAARKADADAFGRKLSLGCGGLIALFVLLIAGGAAWNSLTAVELDEPAREACSAAETASLTSLSNVRRGAHRVEAVQHALESEIPELRDAAGPSRINPETVNTDYYGVAAWCEENVW